MKLAFITPVADLERYGSQSEGVHLALVHTALRSSRYADWFKLRAKDGDTVILDNGAFEHGEPATLLEIREAANRIQPTTIVAPDYPGRPARETLEALAGFAADLPDQFAIFGCPQSVVGDYRGWFEAACRMLETPRLSHVGVSILACPNAFGQVTGTADIELNRFAATCYLKQQGFCERLLDSQVQLHYLGLGHRLDLVRYYEIVSSLDTSSPVWHGRNNISYSHGFLPQGKLKLPVDFEAPPLDPTDLRHGVIQANIDILKQHARAAEEAL